LAIAPEPRTDDTNIFIPTRVAYRQNRAILNFPKQKQAFLIALAVFGICKNNPLRVAKSLNSLVESGLMIFQIGFVFIAVPDELKRPSVRTSVGMEDSKYGNTGNSKASPRWSWPSSWG
jgi:hypothetical protein